MARLLKLKIDVTKMKKERLFKGAKGTYADLDVWIEDEPDEYGNDASICHSPTKEEREAGEKKIYVGNGKKLFGWSDSPQPRERAATPAPKPDRVVGSTPLDQPIYTNDGPEDDIPF